MRSVWNSLIDSYANLQSQLTAIQGADPNNQIVLVHPLSDLTFILVWKKIA